MMFNLDSKSEQIVSIVPHLDGGFIKFNGQIIGFAGKEIKHSVAATADKDR